MDGKMTEEKHGPHGVVKRNNAGELTQVIEGISFKEAFSMVVDLRGKQDGNYYWIGRA